MLLYIFNKDFSFKQIEHKKYMMLINVLYVFSTVKHFAYGIITRQLKMGSYHSDELKAKLQKEFLVQTDWTLIWFKIWGLRSIEMQLCNNNFLVIWRAASSPMVQKLLSLFSTSKTQKKDPERY